MPAARQSYLTGPPTSISLDETTMFRLLDYFNTFRGPTSRLYITQTLGSARNPELAAKSLMRNQFLSVPWIVLDGRRITTIRTSKGRGSIVLAKYSDAFSVGEIELILQPTQRDLHSLEPLAIIRWLKPTNAHPLQTDVWAPYRYDLRSSSLSSFLFFISQLA